MNKDTLQIVVLCVEVAFFLIAAITMLLSFILHERSNRAREARWAEEEAEDRAVRRLRSKQLHDAQMRMINGIKKDIDSHKQPWERDED